MTSGTKPVVSQALVEKGPHAISESFERLLYLDSTVYETVKRVQARWRAKVARGAYMKMLEEKREMEALMEALRLKELEDKERATKLMQPIWRGWRARAALEQRLMRSIYATSGHAIQVRRRRPRPRE